jgi:hypothetical protein
VDNEAPALVVPFPTVMEDTIQENFMVNTDREHGVSETKQTSVSSHGSPRRQRPSLSLLFRGSFRSDTPPTQEDTIRQTTRPESLASSVSSFILSAFHGLTNVRRIIRFFVRVSLGVFHDFYEG